METEPSALTSSFLEILTGVLGNPGEGIPLHAPEFKGNEWAYVKECLDTGWVSSVGKFVDSFENDLARFTGSKHAIAVVNGTSALQIALILAGVRPGDEVIVPALSFVATANAVAHVGAIPHFVDSNAETLGMDPDALSQHLDHISRKTTEGLFNKSTGRRISAVVPMHTFGHPVNMTVLMAVCNRLGLPVVEDAAESLGSSHAGRMTGTFGLLGILSFNGNKTITTGGGGAILTQDSTLAKRAKHLTTTAKVPHRWAFLHDEIGYNFRLPNLNAALGCAQLEKLPELLQRKRLLADRYKAAFSKSSQFHFVQEPGNSRSNYWLNAVRIKESDPGLLDRLLQATNDYGYHCRPVWTLLSSLPMYAACEKSPLPVAQKLESDLINIPSGPGLIEVSCLPEKGGLP